MVCAEPKLFRRRGCLYFDTGNYDWLPVAVSGAAARTRAPSPARAIFLSRQGLRPGPPAGAEAGGVSAREQRVGERERLEMHVVLDAFEARDRGALESDQAGNGRTTLFLVGG
jgi:hypothetical protein